MAPVSYRRLRPDELHEFSTIDRSEIIDGRYSLFDGTLVLNPMHHVVTGWYPSEIVDHPAHILELIENGGRAFGA